MKSALQHCALELGFDACRVTTADPSATGMHFEGWLREGKHAGMEYLARTAPKRLDPRKTLPGARSVVIVASSYHMPEVTPATATIAPILHSPPGTVARYARFADYHRVLGERLEALTCFLNSMAGPGSRSVWYVDTGPVLERDLAQRAGIGFIGKHTNLVSRHLGNWFCLGEILTTAELEPDAPEPNRCGTCTRCIDACPARAITAPFQLDARLCIAYWTIEAKGPVPPALRQAIGNHLFGCDDCLAACPWNRLPAKASLMASNARPELASIDLADLLGLDESHFAELFGMTPLARSRLEGLKSNACLALGNARHTAARQLLERLSHNPNPRIADHASWALRQL